LRRWESTGLSILSATSRAGKSAEVFLPMQGRNEWRSLMLPRRKSQSRIFCTGKGRREKHEWAVMGPSSLPILDSSLRRIFRWRVPPNWSISDWRNEMRAEAACAAWQAVCDYDPSLGVPFNAFARQRVLTSTLTRYRREWAYALRLAQKHDAKDLDTRTLNSTASALFDAWPSHALT